MTKQREMAKIVFDALDEKKGEDIKIIDISEISIMADYFVVASGSSSTQIQALVRNVEENLHKAGYVMKRMEGDKNSSWFCSISVMLSFMCLTGRTGFFMTLKESGLTERLSHLRSCDGYSLVCEKCSHI